MQKITSTVNTETPKPEITYPCLIKNNRTGTVAILHREGVVTPLLANGTVPLFTTSVAGEINPATGRRWRHRSSDRQPFYGTLTLTSTKE